MVTETENSPAEEQAAAVAPELGQRLVRAREEQDLSLEKAAASLHVDISVLRNLETENFSALGAQVFVRGHLRKYARMLGLPEQELLDAYQSTVGESVDQLVHPVLRETVPVSRRRRRVSLSLLFMVILVLGMLAAASWWWFQMRTMDGELVGKRTIPAGGTPVALNLDEKADATMSAETAAAGESATDDSISGQQNLPSEEQAESVPVGEQVPVSTPGAVSQEISAGSGAESQSLAEPELVQMDLVLNFVEDSWAEVHDGRQKRVLYGLFTAGTRRELDIPAPASVYLGHVDGVSIEVDGLSYDVPAGRRVGNTARFTIEPPQ
jgi:cytoskeleton protein RodZ